MSYPCVYYERQEDGLLGRCKYYSKDGVQSWCTEGMDDCEHETPSNADRIRAMSDEELANFLAECNAYGERAEASQWLPWLKQPAEVENG